MSKKKWIPKRATAPSLKTVRRIVMQNLREWDTPRSLAIFMILDSGSDDDFLGLSPVNPSQFLTATAYAEFSVPTDLIRKSNVLQLSVDRRQTAIDRFHQAEELCRETNLRLKYSSDPKGRLGELIHSMRKIIASVLPEVNRDLLDDFVEKGGWGAGVTSTVKGRNLTFATKLASHQQSTTAFAPLAEALRREIRGMDGKFSIRDYNVVSFVPKDSKTDRAIAIEPSLNAYAQRGAGLVIRSSLKKLGIDLGTGQSRNARMARRGSIDGRFATVDLSMASDTLAYKIVKYLLPYDWSILLEILRSPYYSFHSDGREARRYEKFSSMGNGYTFELETLIFAAAAKAVSGGKEFSVYGDDIIVASDAVEDLASLLSFLGFVFNREKTFLSGPFRESCGSDFFHGRNVRGFYIKNINPVLPIIWYNWLAADRLLNQCPKTMGMLVQTSGPNPPWAPFRSDRCFWAAPVDEDKNFVFAYRHGRAGWWHWETQFRPISKPLNERSDEAGVAAFCRLALANEPTERQPLLETLSEVGTWVRRRTFTEEFTVGDSWPRG